MESEAAVTLTQDQSTSRKRKVYIEPTAASTLRIQTQRNPGEIVGKV